MICKLVLNLLQKNTEDGLSLDAPSIKKEVRVFRVLYSIANLVATGKFTLNSGVLKLETSEELLVMAVIKVHSKKCVLNDCVCKYILGDESAKNIQFEEVRLRYSNFLLSLIYDYFSEASKRIKNSIWLALNRSFLELSKNDGGQTALMTLFQISKTHTTFQQNITIKKLLVKVKEKMDSYYSTGENGVLNIKDFIDYQQLTNHINELIKRNLETYSEFWNCLKCVELPINQLLDVSREIEERSDEISE